MKYALLIGISYLNGSQPKLPGVSNDIISMTKLLKSWGFDSQNIITLSETSNHILPTAFNITKTLNSLVQRLVLGDRVIIYYSGHGMQINGKNVKESCIVPLDNKKSGVITSETIRYYLNRISAGVNVFCIFDCCNSGTVCNLKYHYYDTSYRKELKTKLRMYDPTSWITRQHINIGAGGKDSSFLETSANIVSISGCWDDQVSYDLGKNGALTMSLIGVLTRFSLGEEIRKNGTSSDLKLDNLLKYLRGSLIHLRLNQTPQLMYGRKIDDLSSLSIRDFID